MADDKIQHGIDDDPNNDAEKGATLGGLGGAAVGAAAGAMAGPLGAVVGAVVGGLTGAGASGLAVGAVDRVDNDNTVSGVGSSHPVSGSTLSGADVVDVTEPRRTDMADSGQNAVFGTAGTTVTHTPDVSDMNIDRGIADVPNVRSDGPTLDAGAMASGSATTPVSMSGGAAYGTTNPDAGIQTGGMTTAGPDTRGLTEKVADTVTGDRMDDKTGGVVAHSDSIVGTDPDFAPSTTTSGTVTEGVGGHNVVTGEEATTDSGKHGLAAGALAGGALGAAVGGPVGAVVGGAIGSLTGGVAGDADEAKGTPDDNILGGSDASDMDTTGTNAGRRGI